MVKIESHTDKIIFKDLFNPNCQDFVDDPYHYYDKVRTTNPVYKTPYGVHVLTQASDIQTVMASRDTIKDYWGPLLKIYGNSCYQESGFSLISKWLINKNPPQHAQIRRVLVAALSRKKLLALNEVTYSIANKLIDEFCDRRDVDIIKHYAYKLPALVIYKLLGIPESAHQFLFEQAALPSVLLDPRCLSRSVIDCANLEIDRLKDFFKDLCKERRNQRGNDLLSLLLDAREKEKIDLSDEDLVSNIFFLFGAGHETTMNLIGNGLYCLFKYPANLQKLLGHWELLPSAIEEMLRFEAPVQVASPSVLMQAIQLGSYALKEGSVVMPVLGSACRDPNLYLNPNNFDITRKGKGSLAFGYGTHLCLGAQLARLEGAIAVQTLFERLPKLSIDVSVKPVWNTNVSVRGLVGLRASW